MLTDWYNLLERLVVAIERIAARDHAVVRGLLADANEVLKDTPVKEGHLPTGKAQGPEPPAEQETAEQETAEAQAEQEKVESLAEKDAKALEREMIKKELRDLGVTFNPSAQTASLRKLLEQTKNPPTMPVGAGAPVLNVTIEQVRSALVELSGLHGRDAGLQILRREGLAERLSDVAPSRYAFILDACRRGMVNNE